MNGGSENKSLFERARQRIPGGVNSPVRSFGSVGPDPPFIASAEGAYVMDEDGRRYIDYVGSYGPLILGHASPSVIKAVQEAAARGTSYGAPTRLEVELAELICELMPSIDLIRMVNSGTEASMSAIRLARGYTNRAKIVKFKGCYHGHVDPLLVAAGSGAAALGTPDSLGVTEGTVRDTIVLPYNDTGALETAFERWGREIAAVIIEPVAGNMGLVPAEQGFLNKVRELTRAHGSVLIFDEVMSGFRVHLQGAQALYGIEPDLTCLGKVIGGGMPVGAFGGKKPVMSAVAPLGNVYQAGTLSGNPVAVAAGLATLRELIKPGVFEAIAGSTADLAEGITKRAQEAGVPVQVPQVGTMFSVFYRDQPVRNVGEARAASGKLFERMFSHLLAEGVYLAPSPFETAFVSKAHGSREIEATLAAFEKAFQKVNQA